MSTDEMSLYGFSQCERKKFVGLVKRNNILLTNYDPLTSVHPETASLGPILRSRIFSILDVGALRLRSKNPAALS
jgi:hypothetical protein